MSPSTKKILVTGASRGIGRATALQLVESDVQVIGMYNTGADEAKQLLTEGVAEVVQCNFADRAQTAQVIADLAKAHQFDGLVNNAGVVEFEKWDEFTLESWDQVFEINLRAPLALVNALSRTMPAGGAIVNVASTDGLIGSFSSMSYSASKAALINLTKSLANVLGSRGIRVNSVSPGWIDTGMSTEESYEATQLTPLARNGQPEEVGSLVKFLLSEDARFITGANIVVDGGYTGVDSIMKKENDAL